MAVVRNTFTGTLSASPSTLVTAHTITGLTSETSTINVNIVPEASLHFLNALYQTLLDAGYDDTVKNEEDYSITVLGFKFFVVWYNSSNKIYCNLYTYGCKSAFSPGTYPINSNTSPYTNLSYNITVRGDAGHISIIIGLHNMY